jgi:nicotinate-nucleotide adenylyltransferase
LKVGLFFGSFNPIHIGHLAIANIMAETANIDQVWFVVSPQNPFKNTKGLAHEFDRIDMVEAAIYDNPKLRATNIEFNMPKPSYTIDTLAYLSDKYPSYQFSLIIGEDNLKNFPKWKNYEVILKQYGLYVYPRPNTGSSKLKDHPSVKWVKSPLFDISATFIRNLMQLNKSIKYLVPDAVIEVINNRKLYI